MAWGEVVWALTGDFRAQHDPKILENGNLLLFDNLGRGTLSRILKVTGKGEMGVVGIWHWIATIIAFPISMAAGWLIEDRRIKRGMGKGTGTKD